ncbi:MAG: hypothetical protein E6J86_14195 [Deltaproteobacteria bacterium]|nr:MAG: hypothetical protein E6J86_14195 [Deltaproteobacteria bacterium]
MRPLPTAVSALAIALLSSGVVRAEQCRPIDTTIVTWFTPCAPNESPVGFCTQGVIASGLLAGTTRFGVQTMTGSDSVTTYSGILTITTKSGRLRLNDYGILTAKGKFSELEQVVSGPASPATPASPSPSTTRTLTSRLPRCDRSAGRQR